MASRTIRSPASRSFTAVLARGRAVSPASRHIASSVLSVRESEADFQAWIIDLAGIRRWAIYHTYDSRRSNPGFPDLVLVRERVLFREVKTEGGVLTGAQSAWLNRLTRAGADAGVWRPSDRRSIEKELE